MKTQRGKPRDPVKEQFWRRAISDQAQSDLPTQAYCQRKGLNPRSFRSWRQAFARREAEATSARPDQRPASSTELARAAAFLPVRVVQDGAAEPIPETGVIEIVLPVGPTVRVTRGFDPHALDAVLSVLEARRC
jgi:hypothetical protein